MIVKSKALIGITSALLIAGCSSTPTSVQVTEQELASEKMMLEAEQERKEMESESIKKEIKALPDWVIEPPPSDASGVYAVGSGVSKSPELAIKKAKLKAEFVLAQSIRQEVSGQERVLDKESSEGAPKQHYELLVDRFVAAVPVKGYNVIETEVYSLEGEAHAHALFRLSRSAMKEALAEGSELYESDVPGAAFAELQKRVKGDS